MKVILYGIGGRMGQAIISAAKDNTEIVAGIDKNVATVANVTVFSSLAECNISCDVVIDFSSPTSLADILAYCKRTGAGAVLATTGYSKEQEAEIAQAAEEIAIVKSGNMSLGVNLLAALVKKAYQTLGEDFDIEIIEKHHNQKVDAPSGTALLLADSINSVQPHNMVYGREGSSKRQKEIGVHAVRGGTIVGEHDVIFAGTDEIITLSHSAQSRAIFAKGALKAAQFLTTKNKGIFNMQHVLNL